MEDCSFSGYDISSSTRATFIEGHVLPDEEWHVASYYDNIRNKVKNLNPDLGDCVKGYDGIIPTRMCTTQLRVRSDRACRNNLRLVCSHLFCDCRGEPNSLLEQIPR
jgi:hypothetical protein